MAYLKQHPVQLFVGNHLYKWADNDPHLNITGFKKYLYFTVTIFRFPTLFGISFTLYLYMFFLLYYDTDIDYLIGWLFISLVKFKQA